EPGIGKTRLVSEFAHVALDSGALVLAGRCDEGLSRPYQPFVEALEHLVAHAPPEMLDRHVRRHGDSITRLIPALGAGSRGASPEPTESERYVLFESIDELLATASKGGPLVLVLEDVHWADPPTLQLLGWLVNKPRSWPLMLASTCRIHGTDKD